MAVNTLFPASAFGPNSLYLDMLPYLQQTKQISTAPQGTNSYYGSMEEFQILNGAIKYAQEQQALEAQQAQQAQQAPINKFAAFGAAGGNNVPNILAGTLQNKQQEQQAKMPKQPFGMPQGMSQMAQQPQGMFDPRRIGPERQPWQKVVPPQRGTPPPPQPQDIGSRLRPMAPIQQAPRMTMNQQITALQQPQAMRPLGMFNTTQR